VHSLLLALATAPAPTPTPSLRPGLSEDQVTPGLLGFLLTAFIVVLTAFLIVDMVRRIRRVRYRGQLEEAQVQEALLRAGGTGAAGAGMNDADAVAGLGDAGPGSKADGAPRPAKGADFGPETNGDAGPGNR
jgi:hypothetical protein